MTSAACRTQALDILSEPGDMQECGNNQASFIPRFVDFDTPSYSLRYKAAGSRTSVPPLDSSSHIEYT
jgi:hypothetical protein